MIAVTRSFGAWRLETTDSCNMASVTQIEDLDACSTARTAGTAGTAHSNTFEHFEHFEHFKKHVVKNGGKRYNRYMLKRSRRPRGPGKTIQEGFARWKKC